jgi:hypothetical protein
MPEKIISMPAGMELGLPVWKGLQFHGFLIH